MKAASCVVCFAVILMGFSGSVLAQSVISAKSGQINYTDGIVFLEGKEVQSRGGLFPQMKASQELKTEDSRAELLLSPGVFLRVGENSSIKMLSDQLEDTRLELFRGSLIVEGDALVKGDAVTLVYKNAVVTLVKNGLYRLDSEPAQLRVYGGEALVEQGGQTVTVKKAYLLPLNGLMLVQKFDNKTGDALLRWTRRRAEYLALANPSVARSYQGGCGGLSLGSWIFNPYFGMHTFVPCNGFSTDFWGNRFWSPSQVWMVYNPPQSVYSGGGNWDGGRSASSSGYSGMATTSYGSSGTAAVSSTPGTASSSSSVGVGGSSSAPGGGSHR
ncbi:MAG: hypothetical protein ABSE56_11895 [Bryobacteraceae bacterium]|jgi:hypothetical protein